MIPLLPWNARQVLSFGVPVPHTVSVEAAGGPATHFRTPNLFVFMDDLGMDDFGMNEPEMGDPEMDEPSPEFMAASYIAQIAPLLFDAADKAPEIGEQPQHVAVADETVTAHLKRQNFDVERTVATVQKVPEGIEIEYQGRTVTLSFDDAG